MCCYMEYVGWLLVIAFRVFCGVIIVVCLFESLYARTHHFSYKFSCSIKALSSLIGADATSY